MGARGCDSEDFLVAVGPLPDSVGYVRHRPACAFVVVPEVVEDTRFGEPFGGLVWADAVRSQPVAAVSRGGRGRRLDRPFRTVISTSIHLESWMICAGAPPSSPAGLGPGGLSSRGSSLARCPSARIGSRRRSRRVGGVRVSGCSPGLKGRGVRPMGLVDVVRVRDQTHLVALELAVHDLRDGQPVDGRSGDRLGSCGSGQSGVVDRGAGPGVRPRPRPTILPGRRAASCPLSPSCRAGGGDGPAPRRPGNAGGGKELQVEGMAKGSRLSGVADA